MIQLFFHFVYGEWNEEGGGDDADMKAEHKSAKISSKLMETDVKQEWRKEWIAENTKEVILS